MTGWARLFARERHGRLLASAAIVFGVLLLQAVASERASAVPAPPDSVHSLRQPDGTTFRAHLIGDEWYHWQETARGYTVLRNPETRVWEYAEVVEDTGALTLSGLVVTDDSPWRLERHLVDQVRVARAQEQSAKALTVPRIAAPIEGGGAEAPVYQNTGEDRSLVILTQFTNSASRGSTAASWASKFFGTTNSVRSYYSEVSYGKFTIAPAAETSGTVNDGVVGWVTLNMAHPGTNNTNVFSAVNAAIRAADPFVNYASYDSNRNGWIEPNELHITLIAAGGEAATSCAQPSVWAHKNNLGSYAPSVDGVRPAWAGYTIFGEQQCNGGAHFATIGVIAHEFGHDLGWPDEYDTDKSSANTSNGGVGSWSLMASGTWNYMAGSYSGSSPAHPDAFLKSYQGWLTPQQITGSQTGVQLASAAANARAVQLLPNPNGVDWSFGSKSGTGEYFLVENRQRTGFDQALPSCGVLIWHIDETRTSANTANADDTRRLVQLMDADGNGIPRESTDTWTGAKTFSDATTPSAKLYSGAASGVTVSGFSACGATMTVKTSDSVGLANDSFGSATAVSALPYAQTGLATGSATVQTSEPTPTCGGVGKTVWYRFTPNKDYSMTASTNGANFDTVLQVWRGTSITGLTAMGCNDDSAGQGGYSQVSFNAQAGQTYYFQVGGYTDANNPPASGSLSFSLTGTATGPANDAFTAATAVSTLPFSQTGLTTASATTETSEPTPTCGGVGKTVWYRFTPNQSYSMTASTNGANFDTVLQVWRGTAIAGLTAVGCNDDFAGDGGYSQVAFNAQAGQTYYLQVGGFTDANNPPASGSLNVSLTGTSSGPVNDAFASATVASSLPYTQTGLATGSAGTDVNEPAATCGGVGKTVWYRFTPSQDTSVTVATTGSNFDTVLQAWRGTSITGLTAIGCSDDVADAGGSSQVTFTAQAGQSYYFQIGGYTDVNNPPASGLLNVSLTGTAVGLPNDGFTKATVVTSLPFSVTGLATASATTETSEPTPTCGGVGKTVWYRYTPTQTVSLTASTNGANFDTVLQVWRGTSISGLTAIGCNDDFAGQGGYSQASFTAQAGQTYFFQIGGFTDANNPPASGSLSFSVIAP